MIGEKLRRMRQERRWSQEKLGKMIGLSQASVSEMERGLWNPTLSCLYALAAVYGVEAGELLRTEDGSAIGIATD